MVLGRIENKYCKICKESTNHSVDNNKCYKCQTIHTPPRNRRNNTFPLWFGVNTYKISKGL